MSVPISLPHAPLLSLKTIAAREGSVLFRNKLQGAGEGVESLVDG
ncbi:MAG: hypothetical protein ACI9C1_003439 [Candidatus Aldehydirespiratoraceae bacterium]|jgi:hypothetical protein